MSVLISQSLRSLLRTIRHRPAFVVLNTLGLSLGLATLLVLGSIVRSEFTYDRWVPDGANTVRVDDIGTDIHRPPEQDPHAPFVLLEGLQDAIPSIASATRLVPDSLTTNLHGQQIAQAVTFVDPQFLDTLRYPLVAGSRDALAEPDGAVLSDATARAYFGSAQAALGQVVNFTDEGHVLRVVVRAVLAKVPPNSTIDPEILLRIPQWVHEKQIFKQWGMTIGSIYLRVRKPSDLPGVAQAMRQFIHDRATIYWNKPYGMDVALVPLARQHWDSDRLGTGGAGYRQTLALLGVGVLALLAAIINALNLLTARAILRGREAAMRKTLGATPRQLAAEAVLEAVLLVALAVIPALALVELGLPVVNASGGWNAQADYGWLLGVTALVVVPTGVLAGLYPAFVLSRMQASRVLAASRAPALGRMGASVRTVLVSVQFTFAVGLSICALVVLAQARLEARNAGGFVREGLLYIGYLDGLKPAQRTAYLERVRAIRGIEGVTWGFTKPDGFGFSAGTPIRRADRLDTKIQSFWQAIGPDYARVMGVTLLAGRPFDDAHTMDNDALNSANSAEVPGRSVMINALLAQRLGFLTPQAAIGARIRFNDHKTDLIVIGVMADTRLGSARNSLRPQIYFYWPTGFIFQSAFARVHGRAIRDVTADLHAAWTQSVPDQVFASQSVDAMMFEKTQGERALGRLILIGTVIAMLIASLGIYGLASFDAARRSFEIGIRKTLGATAPRVVALMLGRFLKPVWPALALGSAAAFVLMRQWLAGYDLRVGLSPFYFLPCCVAALFICLVAVGGSTWALARVTPARALRHD